MSKKTTQRRTGKSHLGFEQAIRERPRDAAPRLIYADWLEEQGEEHAAEMQRLKAKQCTRFDPDFDYPSYLKKMRVAGKIRVKPIAFGEIVVLVNKSSGCAEKYCDSASLQSWFLERIGIRKRRLSGLNSALEWFIEHVPGVDEIEEVEGKQFSAGLQAAFEGSKGPEYRESKRVVVRSVGNGYHVIRGGLRKQRWSLLAGDLLDDYAREHGEVVFNHERLFATLAGTDYVGRFNGEYWSHIDDCGTFGPYVSLEEALTDDNCESHVLVQVTEASSSIHSSELSAEEIAKLLEVLDCGEGNVSVGINGEVWQADESGKFKKVEDEKEIDRLERHKWSLIFDIEPDDDE